MGADLEVLRLQYALTLREWYARVEANKAEIVKLYDERFYRMWKFYLAGSATAFEYGNMIVYQVQYLRNRHAVPITRDYMAAAEAKLRAKSEEHTSELQSLMRISYAVFCLKKKIRETIN